ncbi:MAG: ABC transporter permease, partial [Clostridiales Family XIII bacterium]|nr:ABC transporter permease [Clostridiales Family XIII bacterium]
YARLTRAPVFQVKNEEYIEAARAVSAGKARIMLRHLLPNILSPLIVQTTVNVAMSILLAAGLSFLGMGVQPPNPEWGAIITSAKAYIIDHSYMVTTPGIAISLTVIALNLFGDGLRDCLDPRLKI